MLNTPLIIYQNNYNQVCRPGSLNNRAFHVGKVFNVYK
jgi:hypothetical protein